MSRYRETIGAALRQQAPLTDCQGRPSGFGGGAFGADRGGRLPQPACPTLSWSLATARAERPDTAAGAEQRKLPPRTLVCSTVGQFAGLPGRHGRCHGRTGPPSPGRAWERAGGWPGHFGWLGLFEPSGHRKPGPGGIAGKQCGFNCRELGRGAPALGAGDSPDPKLLESAKPQPPGTGKPELHWKLLLRAACGSRGGALSPVIPDQHPLGQAGERGGAPGGWQPGSLHRSSSSGFSDRRQGVPCGKGRAPIRC